MLFIVLEKMGIREVPRSGDAAADGRADGGVAGQCDAFCLDRRARSRPVGEAERWHSAGCRFRRNNARPHCQRVRRGPTAAGPGSGAGPGRAACGGAGAEEGVPAGPGSSVLL